MKEHKDERHKAEGLDSRRSWRGAPSASAEALRFALRKTLPVLPAFLILGFAFGILMNEAGFSAWWTVAVSLFVYAGSLQFLLVGLMQSGSDLATVAVMTLLVNSRHIFYGIPFLERFRKMGRSFPYMVFSLTDETFAVLCSLSDCPLALERKQVDRWIAILNHFYWVLGSLLGAVVGKWIPLDFKGIEFSMTALFTVILVEQLRAAKDRLPAWIALFSALSFFFLLGPEHFILPSLLCTLALLYFYPQRRALYAD